MDTGGSGGRPERQDVAPQVFKRHRWIFRIRGSCTVWIAWAAERRWKPGPVALELIRHNRGPHSAVQLNGVIACPIKLISSHHRFLRSREVALDCIVTDSSGSAWLKRCASGLSKGH